MPGYSRRAYHGFLFARAFVTAGSRSKPSEACYEATCPDGHMLAAAMHSRQSHIVGLDRGSTDTGEEAQIDATCRHAFFL